MAQKHQNGGEAVQGRKRDPSKGREAADEPGETGHKKGEQKCVCWILGFSARVLVIWVSGFVVRVRLVAMEAGGRVLGC